MLGRLSNTFWLALSGVISVIFGVVLIAAPSEGVLAVLWLVGFYAILVGVSFIAFGIRLRGAGSDLSAFEGRVNDALGSSSASRSSTGSSDGSTSSSS